MARDLPLPRVVARLHALDGDIGSHASLFVCQVRTQAQNLASRFRLHGQAYFRIITTSGVEPTNYLDEQAIRFVVIGRAIAHGTRSEEGRQ